MRRKIVPILVLAGVAALAAQLAATGWLTPSTPPLAAAQARVAEAISGPGRVEPVSEEIAVSAQIGGRLASILVEEGQRVSRGAPVATIDGAEIRARVAAAEAELAQEEARLLRILNGARAQEREQARATVREAEAVAENTRSEAHRRKGLFERGVVAREEAERADREWRVALARLEAARQLSDLVDDDAREEDRSEAEASVALARARLAEARAMLEKTIVRSPIDGVVLKKHLRAGESISSEMPTPIVTVADTTVLRVRVDVDETDVAFVAPGQAAYVTAAAYGDRRFSGRVVRVGHSVGRKTVRTDEPTERVDTKVLEVLVELDPGQTLPVGLRVDAFLATASQERGG